MRNATVEWINRPLAALLETSESAIVGKPVRSLFRTEEEFGQVCRDLQIHRDALGNGCAECELVRTGGSIVACTLQARLLDPLDAKKGGTVVVTDISEKKKMRDALKESEAKYREMMKNAQSIIVRTGYAGHHHLCQYLRRSILRLSREPDSSGKTWSGRSCRRRTGAATISR